MSNKPAINYFLTIPIGGIAIWSDIRQFSAISDFSMPGPKVEAITASLIAITSYPKASHYPLVCLRFCPAFVRIPLHPCRLAIFGNNPPLTKSNGIYMCTNQPLPRMDAEAVASIMSEVLEAYLSVDLVEI